MIVFMFNAIIVAIVIVAVGWSVQYLYEEWYKDSEWRGLPNVKPGDEFPEDDRLFTESHFRNPDHDCNRHCASHSQSGYDQ